MQPHDLQNLRREYQNAELSRDSVATSPLIQLEKWLEQAIQAELTDATAMVLSTVDEKNHPCSRVVLLKDMTQEKLIFYTHYDSHKARDIAHNPWVCVNFYWPQLERQVIVQGQVAKISAQESDAYFRTRPRESQISTWASHQSQILASRAELITVQQEYAEKFNAQDVPRPQHWGGYAITPVYVEFWQGRVSRLHDRMLYQLRDGKWEINRLSP